MKKPLTLHIYHAQKQSIVRRAGVNGQFSCWKKITMESHGDVFISDLKKRMSSEVTQFAKLFRVMKARVMIKKDAEGTPRDWVIKSDQDQADQDP